MEMTQPQTPTSGQPPVADTRVKALAPIVAVGLIAAIYLVWAQFTNFWPFQPDGQTPVEQGAWKIYRSELYGFEISYPPRGAAIGTLETSDSMVITAEATAGATSENSISLDILPAGTTQGDSSVQLTKTELDGRPALQGAFTSASGTTVGYVVEVGRSKELFIQVPGLPSPSAFDEILASFNFTGELFSSSEYRFTFMYPLNWYVRREESGRISVADKNRLVWVGLDAPDRPELYARGTLVLIDQSPAKSLQDFVTTQTLSGETYVASPYAGWLMRQGQVPGTAGHEQYLTWHNDLGVSVVLYSSVDVVPDREGLLQILSTFTFTR